MTANKLVVSILYCPLFATTLPSSNQTKLERESARVGRGRMGKRAKKQMYPLTLLCPFNIWMDSRQSRYTKIQVHTAVTNNTQYNIHTQSELMRTSQTNICWTHISFIFSSNLSICFIRFYLSVASFCHFSCCCPLWFMPVPPAHWFSFQPNAFFAPMSNIMTYNDYSVRVRRDFVLGSCGWLFRWTQSNCSLCDKKR